LTDLTKKTSALADSCRATEAALLPERTPHIRCAWKKHLAANRPAFHLRPLIYTLMPFIA